MWQLVQAISTSRSVSLRSEPLAGDPVILGDMARLAFHVGSRGRHVHGRTACRLVFALAEGKIPALDRIPATCLGVADKAIGPVGHDGRSERPG